MFKRCGRGGWLCGPACKDHAGRSLSMPAFLRKRGASKLMLSLWQGDEHAEQEREDTRP